jgi:hypothetical protein
MVRKEPDGEQGALNDGPCQNHGTALSRSLKMWTKGTVRRWLSRKMATVWRACRALRRSSSLLDHAEWHAQPAKVVVEIRSDESRFCDMVGITCKTSSLGYSHWCLD